MVPAVLDRLRRHPRPADGRRAGRALAVAELRQHPVRVPRVLLPAADRAWETVADTGGAGLHRGGNGVDVAYRFLSRPARSPSTTTAGSPTLGRARRRARRARHQVGRARSTAPARCCRARCHDVRSRPGELLHFVTWGGGRLGRPAGPRRPLVAPRGAARAGQRRRRPPLRRRAATTRARSTPTATAALRGAAGRAAGPTRCRSSTRARPWRRSWPGALDETGLPAPRRPIARGEPRPRTRATTFADGFGGRLRSRADGPRWCAIDLMRAYFEPSSPLCLPSRQCLGSGGAGAGGRARRRRPVVHTRVRVRRGRQRTAACSSARSRRCATLYGDGPRPASCPRSHRRAGELVLIKQYASAFFGTSLAATLVAARGRHGRPGGGQHQRLHPGDRGRRRPARLRAAGRARRGRGPDRRRPRRQPRTTCRPSTPRWSTRRPP